MMEWSFNFIYFYLVFIVIIVGVGCLTIRDTRRNHQNMKKKVDTIRDDISNIGKKQEGFNKNQEIYVYNILLNTLKSIHSHAFHVEEYAEKYLKSKDENKIIDKGEYLTIYHDQIKDLSKNSLDHSFEYVSQFLDSDTIAELKIISKTCKDRPIFSKDGMKVDVQSNQELLILLEPCIDKFEERLEALELGISENTSNKPTPDSVGC